MILSRKSCSKSLQLDFKFENDLRLFHKFIKHLRARLGESIIEGESNISSNQKLSFVNK